MPNATGASYTSLPTDVGRTMKATVLATAVGSQTTASLAGITWQIIERKPVNTALPTVIGDAYVGGTLDSSAGAWTGNGITYSRQWLVCDADGNSCNAIPVPPARRSRRSRSTAAPPSGCASRRATGRARTSRTRP